jgi:spore photoproduct lyase
MGVALLTPERVYYETGIDEYPLGRELMERYSQAGVPLIEIGDHNKIPELRELPDSEFVTMKKYLILGIRKTTRLIPNNRSADFIVPFTSSGCSAMCLYCYQEFLPEGLCQPGGLPGGSTKEGREARARQDL